MVILAFLDSPRLRQTDNIDSSLSRYQVPDLTQDSSLNVDSEEIDPCSPNAGFVPARVDDLVRLRWRGLVPAKFISQLFMVALKKLSQTQWLGLRVESFDGSVYTNLKRGEIAMLWECN